MKLFLLEFFIAARFVNLAVSLPQYQFASHKGTGTPRSEQTSQASDEMDEQDDQIAHHRIVAGREIPTNYERNNNSPATGGLARALLERCGHSRAKPRSRADLHK